MNFFKSNLFVLVIFYILLPILNIFMDFDAIYLMQVLTVWALVVMFHEIGHCIFAKLRGMKISFISGLPVMYMNDRWYFRIPMYFSFGAMLAYKPLNKGHITKKDIIWLNLGGAIFNLGAIIVLLTIKYGFSIEHSVLNFAILANILIGVVTGLNPMAADGKSIWNIIRGRNDELLFYDSMNYMYDSEISAERILNEVDANRDIIANYSRNIAWIEQQSDMDNFQSIYETELYDENLNLKLTKAFQMLYKAADGHELDSVDIEIFNEVNQSLYFIFGDIYKYFKNEDQSMLNKIKKHKTWFPSSREDKVFYNALKNL